MRSRNTDQVPLAFGDGMTRWAEVSKDGRYRWILGRLWAPDLPRLGWVMLNPSTADATEDDPSTLKTIGFAKRAGFGATELANTCGLRATHPRELLAAIRAAKRDAVGDQADARIVDLMSRCSALVLAWGEKCPQWRALEVLSLIEAERTRLEASGARPCSLLALGYTAAGHPMHPLMVPYVRTLEPYGRRGVCERSESEIPGPSSPPRSARRKRPRKAQAS